MRKYIYIAVGFLFFISCGKDQIIPEKDMVMILKEVYLTDGVVSLQSCQKYHLKDSIEYYEPLLQSYGYSVAQFDSSIKYYTQHTEDFDIILDRVILELSKMDEKLNETVNENDSLRNQSVDSTVNLWPHKETWDMAIDHYQNPSLGFNIPVKGRGLYSVSFSAKVLEDDKSENTRLNIFFHYDDSTTVGKRTNVITKNYPKDTVTRNYSYTLELKDSLTTHLNGWLYDHEGESKTLRRHAIFSNIRVTYKPFAKDSSKIEIINQKFERPRKLEMKEKLNAKRKPGFEKLKKDDR